MRTACFVGLTLTLALVACAQGAADNKGNPSASGTSASGTSAGGAGAGGSTGSSSTSSGGSTSGGGRGGEAPCEPQQHVCDGSCVGNTPETGCSGSTTCDPCAAPPMFANGICTPEGQCDFLCMPPYTKGDMACTCTTECCSDPDCASPNICFHAQCDACTIACPFKCLEEKGCPGHCDSDQCQCDC